METTISYLKETIRWVNELSDFNFKWHMLILADDPAFHDSVQRQALIYEALKRMGL